MRLSLLLGAAALALVLLTSSSSTVSADPDPDYVDVTIDLPFSFTWDTWGGGDREFAGDPDMYTRVDLDSFSKYSIKLSFWGYAWEPKHDWTTFGATQGSDVVYLSVSDFGYDPQEGWEIYKVYSDYSNRWVSSPDLLGFDGTRRIYGHDWNHWYNVGMFKRVSYYGDSAGHDGPGWRGTVKVKVRLKKIDIPPPPSEYEWSDPVSVTKEIPYSFTWDALTDPDREFAGHGPDMWTYYEHRDTSKYSIRIRLWGTARETCYDWTTYRAYYGSDVINLSVADFGYDPQEGWEIYQVMDYGEGWERYPNINDSRSVYFKDHDHEWNKTTPGLPFVEAWYFGDDDASDDHPGWRGVIRVEARLRKKLFVPSCTVTDYPSSVEANDSYSISWFISGGTNISHTNVHWGTSSGNLNNFGTAKSGTSPSSFTDTLTAPSSGTIYFKIHYIVDGTNYYTSEEYSIVTVPSCTVTDYPSSVEANDSYSISWFISGGTNISHTNVHWGTSSGNLNNFGTAKSGTSPSSFTDTLTAPSSGTIYFVIHYIVDGTGYYTSEYSISVVDTTPPTTFDLSSPADDSWVNTKRPTLSWEASSDTGSGLKEYRVYVDDTHRTTVTETSWTLDYDLAEGSHTWYVVAVDYASNTRQSASTFTVNRIMSNEEIASSLPTQLPVFSETVTDPSFAGGTPFTYAYDPQTNVFEWTAPDYYLSMDYDTSQITLDTPVLSGSWLDYEDRPLLDYTAMVSVVPPFFGEGPAYMWDSKGEYYEGHSWGVWNVYTPLTIMEGDRGTGYIEVEAIEIGEFGISSQGLKNYYTGDWEVRGKGSVGIPLVANVGASSGVFSNGDSSAYGISWDIDGDLFGTITGSHVLNINVKPVVDGAVAVGEYLWEGGEWAAGKVADAASWGGDRLGDLWDGITGLFSSPPLPLTEEVHAARDKITNDLVAKIYTILTTTPVKARGMALESMRSLECTVQDEGIRSKLKEAIVILEQTENDSLDNWRVEAFATFDGLEKTARVIKEAIFIAKQKEPMIIDNLIKILDELLDTAGLLAGDVIYDEKVDVGFTERVGLADNVYDMGEQALLELDPDLLEIGIEYPKVVEAISKFKIAYAVIVDNTPPISKVNAIDPYWRNIVPLDITATASDDWSGVYEVALWYRYSPDNVVWERWQRFGVDNQEPWGWEFDAPAGYGFYEFYSIARDMAGNVEGSPAEADARCATLIPATIDIDPDTLNLKSQGRWITAYIELPSGCDVANIDVNTIALEGDIFLEGILSAELWPTEIGDHDGDGVADLMVKFDRSAVQELVSVGDVELTVIGKWGPAPFRGSDTIQVIDPGQGGQSPSQGQGDQGSDQGNGQDQGSGGNQGQGKAKGKDK